MRRGILVVFAVALVAVGLAGCAAPAPSGGSSGGAAPAAPTAATVAIKEFTFQPATIEVAVGGTVTWTNVDAATHTIKGSGWESGELAQQASYSNTFDTAGTFPYSCGIHPTMTGEVVVK